MTNNSPPQDEVTDKSSPQDELTDNSNNLLMHEDEDVAPLPRQGRKRRKITSVVATVKRQTRTNLEYVGDWSKDLNSNNPLH